MAELKNTRLAAMLTADRQKRGRIYKRMKLLLDHGTESADMSIVSARDSNW